MLTRPRTIKPLLTVTVSICLLGSFGARADALHVTAASATSNKAFELTFTPPGGTAAALGVTPLPASPKSSVRSMVYLPNDGTGVLDLIAADFNGSRIVRYAGAAATAVNIWAAPADGPKSPEGLSADSGGNLFVNRGDAGHPELWVLRRDPAYASGVAFLPPVLVDNTHFGTGIATRLLETLVVRGATAGGLAPGDLLVLVSDGRVMRYSAASIKAFINNGQNPTGPKPVPQTIVAIKQFPLGQTPTGMAMWPADSSISGFSDSSLLVATIGGSILRFQLLPTSSNPLHAFATGLGLSLGKIKTFTRLNGDTLVPYAVFDQPLRSKIFEFGSTPPPPAGSPTGTGGCPNLKAVCNNALAVIASVSNPVALATTDASVPSTACVTTDPNAPGCTLLGGGLQVSTTSSMGPNTNSSLLAESCIISDLRSNGLGHCNGSTLSVSDYCPNFPATVIPAHLCATGQPDSNGHNTMVVMKVTETNPLATAPSDLVVNMDVTAEALLGGGLPQPPVITSGWAPLAAEVANSQQQPDWSLHPEMDQFVELGSIYDAPKSRTPGHSLVLAGVQIDPSHFQGDGTEAQQVSFADQKFDSLLAILSPNGHAPILPSAKTDLTNCVSQAQSYLDDPHGNLATADRYACSARQLRTCESGLTAIVGSFGPNTNQLSAYSTVDGRLLNLFTHIYARLGLNPPPASMPLPTPVPTGQCDDTPPNAPNNLSATNVAQTSLTLNWSPASGNGVAVAGYYVLRNGTPVGTVGACTNCSFNDTGLTAGTAYQYSVESFDSWSPPGVSSPAGPLNVNTLPNIVLTSYNYVPGDHSGQHVLIKAQNAPGNLPAGESYTVVDGNNNAYAGTFTGSPFQIVLPGNGPRSVTVKIVSGSNVLATSNTGSVLCYDPDHGDPDPAVDGDDCEPVPSNYAGSDIPIQ